MRLDPQKIKKFRKEILDWFGKHKRDLPWRRTRDPYKILVSEVMLQQTQVARVIPKYEAWLAALPDVQSLAKAKTSHVLALWSGLGYNRRALYLKKAAEKIVTEFGGKFPKNEKALASLPGIGRYTALALLCFAFDKQIAVVDTNVRKVILLRHSGERSYSRIDSGQARMTEKEIQSIADQLLPKGRASEWNQALMDYSNAVLKKEKIPIPKQSKFFGSNRFYRGKIIKLLLTKKKIPINELGLLIKHDFTDADLLWLEILVNGLVHDGLIAIEKQKVVLAR